MKKILIILFTAFFIFGQCVDAAYEFPHNFWDVTSNFEAAVNNKEYNNIIKYGTETIDILENEPQNDQVVSAMADRLQKVAFAYTKTGDYVESARCYQKLIPYAEKKGWNDSVIIAKKRIEQYTPIVATFANGGNPVYYGAKNEMYKGVMFGANVNGQIRGQIPNETMTLTYQELTENVPGYNRKALEEAANKGLAVEYALNFPNERDNVVNIRNYNDKLAQLSKLFDEYNSVPIYLRVAAEFNVWGNIPEPNEYIDCFRYVSDYFKGRNGNVAIVWSPNAVSAWNVNLDDYYPGNQYVDWVGMSAYCTMYFNGEKVGEDDYSEVVFHVGKNADPVLLVKEIIDKYGPYKPIMISESGFSHKLLDAAGNPAEDMTDWASERMSEFYIYLPMVYPQIKSITHFDNYVRPEINDFRVSNNKVLRSQYVHFVNTGRFVKNVGEDNEISYINLKDNVEIGTKGILNSYVHLYNEEVDRVTYFLDGNEIGSAIAIPFSLEYDFGQMTGKHEITTSVIGKNGTEATSRYSVNISQTASETSVQDDYKVVEYAAENDAQADGVSDTWKRFRIFVIIILAAIALYRFIYVRVNYKKSFKSVIQVIAVAGILALLYYDGIMRESIIMSVIISVVTIVINCL